MTTGNYQSRRWDRAITAFDAFAAREGHGRVPAYHREDGFDLGSWTMKTRRARRTGLLSDERIEQLEARPAWEWERTTVLPNSKDAKFWARGIEALTAYAEREGHCMVPSDHREGDVELGTWVTGRRTKHRQGTLAQEHIQQLEAIAGWEWERSAGSMGAKHRANWDAGIEALTAFSAREGHCSVPRKHRENGVGLGYWVDSKRKNYRYGLLSERQIAQLEAFPSWDWGPYDDRWWPDYETFNQFVLAGGSPNPDRGTVHHGLELSGWCKQQRDRYSMGTLSAAATEALEEVPGWSWGDSGRPILERRSQAVTTYRKFVRREGHGLVPVGHVENEFPLGEYLGAARWRDRAGSTSATLEKLLDGVSGDWRSRPAPILTAKQRKAAARYERFVQREGHGRVPGTHVEWGFNLGPYLAAKRNTSAQRLSPTSISEQALDAVNTDWRLPLNQTPQQSTELKVA